MNREHERWMNRALELARQAQTLGEVPVGAVVVRDGQIIGEGFNQPISTNDPTGHAEIRAIRQAAATLGNYRLTDCSLVVTIEPCTMCVGAMIHARIRELIFGAREPRSGAVCSHFQLTESPVFNHSLNCIEGVLAPQCGQLIAAFFQQKRGG